MRSWFAALRVSSLRRLAVGVFAVGVLAVVALLVGGCARNSVLEIELTVPAQPAGTPNLYAVAVFVPGVFEIGTGSVPIDSQYPGAALLGMPRQLPYSVISERADGQLVMVVFFCRSTTCRDEDMTAIPQVWFEFERGTYIGQRTRWSGEIVAVPAASSSEVVCVDRCEVEGCIEGQGWFCREDGSHYCQDRGADPGEEVCDP